MTNINSVTLRSCYIEIINQCNLHCPFCYNGEHSCKSLSVEEYKIILDKLKEGGCKSVTISGGEPLLHPNFMQMVHMTLEYEMDLTILTNGTIENKDFYKLLIEKPDIALQFSLDGSNESINSFTRGKGNFSKVIDKMDYLYKNGYKNGVIRQTLCSHNYDDLESLTKLALKYNFAPYFATVCKSGMATDNWNVLQLTNKQLIALNSRMYNVYEKNSALLLNIKTEKEIEDIKYRSITPKCGCPLFSKDINLSILIKVNGVVTTCQQLYNDYFEIGNILFDSIVDIVSVDNKRLQKQLEFFKTRFEFIHSKCDKECNVYDYCKAGCPALGLQEGNSFLTDSFCSIQKKCATLMTIKTSKENIYEVMSQVKEG